ncbi:hypothetical protein EWM64_g9280 [Hericium alpestre]|uniref:CNNM transmembrane domain-containing protein n=1 Tax=Hericium alpestre TaxID=135208 RepID=A0A4Y9ZJ53_9AGAM|nr:hypothetical protein EWM64_g9280 [Hericium alpestre]
MHQLAKREIDKHSVQYAVFAALIPILVLLSGVFAGLTLGYMSLDETQLHVLSISGTPDQRKYAEKIKPIRRNGHLLLVTLLLANMIVNETLPVISDPVLGGGVQSVVVSTILIVTFSEIIPQSICTRHGLYIGAKMAPFVRVLIWGLVSIQFLFDVLYLLMFLGIQGIVSWPIAKLLEYLLGPHHGIIYRRAELKELIAMHSSVGELGGDLRSDTVTIIGATLDLQEKTAKQAMTKIEDVFMLSIDAKLDYETLKKVCRTGHSRIPVFEEIEMPDGTGSMIKAKKILGILLVKQCVLLDPNDAVPVRSITLNKVPSVAQNAPLLGILDRFQEGRSHMAIVSRMSVGKAASVKKAVKKNLTQRLKDRVGISDSSSSSDEDEEPHAERTRRSWKTKRRSRKDSDHESTGSSSTDQDATLKGEPLHPLAPRWPPSSTDSTYVFSPETLSRSRLSAYNSLSNTDPARQRSAQEVYDNVTAPYDYTEGYHSLMKYLPKRIDSSAWMIRFEKNDILRIVRALAIFRPSLIALQMPLSEEDEVFVEKCFQRSIVELDKLISYSGTPTVVWRRTGEICLVGPEFCILTEWSKEELLGKKKYIWELFENQSVVEYWENFATHAFENTTQSVYSHCVLLKPSGVPVPATFCFSIRRDIFDLPSLVIGQWLPLL